MSKELINRILEEIGLESIVIVDAEDDPLTNETTIREKDE